MKKRNYLPGKWELRLYKIFNILDIKESSSSHCGRFPVRKVWITHTPPDVIVLHFEGTGFWGKRKGTYAAALCRDGIPMAFSGEKELHLGETYKMVGE